MPRGEASAICYEHILARNPESNPARPEDFTASFFTTGRNCGRI